MAARATFGLSVWNWVVIFCKGKFGDGLTSVFAYVLEIFNEKLLSKVAPEELVKYSGLVSALADFGEKVLEIYVVAEGKRIAMAKTVGSLRTLAKALSDGQVTKDELDETVRAIADTITAWKSLRDIQPSSKASIGEIVEQFNP